MQRKLMQHKSYLILAIAALLSTATLPADTVQHVITVPNSTLNYLSGETPLPVSVPQFDGSLGALTAVHVSTKSTMNYFSMVMNFGPSANVTVDYATTANLRRPDNSLILSGSVGEQQQAFVNSFENAQFFGSAEETVQTTLNSVADVALFTGAGNVPLVLGGTGSVTLSDPFNLFDFTDLQLSAEVTVTYEYAVVNTTQEVVLDVHPGSDVNSVNLKSQGVLPVAILSTADFSAADLDASSLRLGDPALAGAVAPLRSAVEDVDGDGLLDLMLHFSTPALVSAGAVDAASVELALSGSTTGGSAIVGADSIRIVPGSTKGKGK